MQELTHSDSAFINFRDYVFAESGGHGFRWINVKKFRVPADALGDQDVLAALIADVRFRNDYAGGGVEPDGTRLGPYWAQNITLDAYRAVTEDDAVNTLQAWVGQHDPLPGTLENVVAREVYSAVRVATSCYELVDLGREAFHDWVGVHIDFNEFVAIDRQSSSMALIVAADD